MIVPAWVKPNLTVTYNDFSAPLLNGSVQTGAINFAETETVNSVSNLTVAVTETLTVPGGFPNILHWTFVEGQRAPADPTPQFWVDPNNPTQSIVGPNGEVFQPLGFNIYDGVNAEFLKYSSPSATYDIIYDASTGLILEADEIFATEEVFRNFASISATPTPSLNIPVITSNGGGATASISFPENGTAVTTVSATEPGTTLAYSIAGGADAASFNINSTSGALTFKTAPNFEAPADSDHNNSYIVQVRASDGSHTDDQTITVNVTDVPEITPAQAHWMKSVNIGAHPAGWLPSGFGDVNADGTSDVFWYNASTGGAESWKIQSGQWAGSVGLGTHPAGYDLAGNGDFNHNGMSDVLWFNPTTNQTDIWLLNNGQWAGSTTLGAHPAGYQAAGVGDFNHDGTSDVLWFNPSTNQTDIWLVNNGQWAGSTSLGAHPAGYQAAGTGDFNHDGTSDVLWFNPTTGQTDIWLVNNGQWAGSTSHRRASGRAGCRSAPATSIRTAPATWSGTTRRTTMSRCGWSRTGSGPAASISGRILSARSSWALATSTTTASAIVMWRDTSNGSIETWLLAYS